MQERETVHLVGGPADGRTLDIPTGQEAVRVLLLTDERQSWVEIADHPRGGVSGLALNAGAYGRTEWIQDGMTVYRYQGEVL